MLSQFLWFRNPGLAELGPHLKVSPGYNEKSQLDCFHLKTQLGRHLLLSSLDWVTSLSLFTFMHWRRKGQPTPVFLPGESQRQWAPVYGVAQSRTRLKWLSSSMLLQNLFLCNCKTGLQFLAGLQSEASFSSLGPIWFIVTWSPSRILW